MKKLSNSHSQRRRSAFTLIEIMVATVIMVVLVGLVIQITSEVLKVWNRSSGKLSANAEARIALEMLTQDLETAVFRNNELQWLRAEDGTSGAVNTVSLKLFSPALDRPDGPGDICAIAYMLENRDPVSGSLVQGTPDDRLWILYRMVVSPQDTFKNLMGVGNQETLPDKDQTTWGSNSIVGQDVAGNEGANYLVSNVVGFEIDFYVEDDDTPGNTLVAGDTIYGGTDATVGPQSTISNLKKPLSYADIRLTVISDEGAALLQNIANVPRDTGETDQEVFDRIIKQHGEVFTRRVNFLARPL
jgi:prepilin-type N-terminal cleavage/methylation domain-containing protein